MPFMKTMLIKKYAEVIEALPNLQFKVRLEDGMEMRAYLSGKMNKNKIRVLPGDNVVIEVPQDIKIENCIARITIRR
jgi:translation initiation factor IF-1